MFGDNPSLGTPPQRSEGIFMLDKTAVESMTDEEISKAIDLLVSEASGRELEASRFRKASLAKSSKRNL